ncbi:MAG: Crp/Fnr family transcriptional regulator [Oscillospiraceae bacterium]|jgi:CRP-like cAMP-binding protein
MTSEYLDILASCPLFAHIDAGSLPDMLDCLAARQRHYAKGAMVLSAGRALPAVGIVLSGGVHVLQEDYWGNRAILAHIAPGGLFGEAFACAGVGQLPVSVQAVAPTDILLVDVQKIITVCSSACAFHTRLVQNLLQLLAQKNVSLTQKIEIITQRSTRKKLLAYLSRQAQAAHSHRFQIPFNRQELADYLAVDRSALSAELSKMQQEGILQYDKNHFQLAAAPSAS